MKINELFEMCTQNYLALSPRCQEAIVGMLDEEARLTWIILVEIYEKKGPTEWFATLLEQDKNVLFELYNWVQYPAWDEIADAISGRDTSIIIQFWIG